ncbi:MAG: phage tail protein [Polyangiaceae bacterium]
MPDGISEVAGGSATAEIILERASQDRLVKKHLGPVKYEDATIRVGTGMSKGFYQWLSDTIVRRPVRKSGAFVSVDMSLKEIGRTEFRNALVTEVEFPAADATSKDAAKIGVTIAPESTQWIRSGAKTGTKVTLAEDSTSTKKWLPANFRFKIDGLSSGPQFVSRIEPIKIKTKAVESAVGDARAYELVPGNVEYSNLVLTLPEARAEEFFKWYDDFVIKGNNDDAKEKSATLEYLSANLQQQYFQLSFKHVGIFRIEPVSAEPNGDAIRRVRVHLYFEDLAFTIGADAAN